jgi:hypothetical protein
VLPRGQLWEGTRRRSSWEQVLSPNIHPFILGSRTKVGPARRRVSRVRGSEPLKALSPVPELRETSGEVPSLPSWRN